MMRYSVFRALNPDEQYPDSPFPIMISGTRYDLPLPEFVSKAFISLLSEEGPFFRIDQYCDPDSFAMIRTLPHAFGAESGYPNYVASELQYKTIEPNWSMMHVLEQAAANSIAAAEIARIPVEETLNQKPVLFSPEVADWIMENSIFFQHGGGFEIARGTFYYAADLLDPDLDMREGREKTEQMTGHPKQTNRFPLFRKILAQHELRPN